MNLFEPTKGILSNASYEKGGYHPSLDFRYRASDSFYFVSNGMILIFPLIP